MEKPSQHIIVLARHGQTDFNLESRIQDPFTPHLTELGHQQARKMGEEIKRLGLNFDAIICADTVRTKETLTEIYPKYKELEQVKIDSRLQERYPKDLVGKNQKDIEEMLKEKLGERFSWHLYFEGTKLSKLTNKGYKNNESLGSVRERLTSLLNDLRNKNSILLIGSSVINQYLLEYLLRGTIGELMPQTPEGKPIDFQENNELRIVALDENMKMKEYSSIKY